MRASRWIWIVALGGCKARTVDDGPADRVGPVPDDGEADADTDADSDTDTAAPDTDTGPFTPVTIEQASVVCDGTAVEYILWTTGRPYSARVFTQETAALEPQWTETHPLPSYESDPGGAWDHLGVELDDGSTLVNPETDWVPGQSTAFRCDEDYGRGLLAFLFVAFYSESSVAACLAYGNNADQVLAGAFGRTSDPDFDTALCEIGVGVGR